MKNRRYFTAEFKSRVALEALLEQKTIAKIASEFEVHPNRVSLWKKRALEQVGETFKHKSARQKSRKQPLRIDYIVKSDNFRLRWTG